MFKNIKITKFKINDLLKITPIVFIFAIWSFGVLYFSSKIGFNQISKNNTSNFETLNNFVTLIIGSTIIVPILEELSYRLPFKNNNKVFYYISYSISIILVLIQNKISLSLLDLLQFLILISSFLIFVSNNFKDTESVLSDKFILLSAISFSLNHIKNYSIQNNYFSFLIIICVLFLQYLPFSLYLSYLRVKYQNGILISILTHSIFNYFALIILYFSILYKL
jgi:Type II CAAX prenyl endopeptidase Rce1-like